MLSRAHHCQASTSPLMPSIAVAIARELGISEPTVRKYLREVDLSDRPQVRRERPSKINRWVPLIEGWSFQAFQLEEVRRSQSNKAL